MRLKVVMMLRLMRKSALVIFLICHGVVMAQEKMEPSVLYLFTENIIATDKVLEDISVYSMEVRVNDDMKKKFIPENLAANWKIIRENELEFVLKQDYASMLILALSRELVYKEYDNYPDLLIYPVKETSAADVDNYKEITASHGTNWLVNIPQIELKQEDNVKSLIVHLQLYNAVSDRLFLDTRYAVNSTEIKGDICEEGIWYCLIQLVKVPVAKDIANAVDLNKYN